MKNTIGLLLLLIGFASCGSNHDDTKAEVPTPKAEERIAVFAGGCFWSIQEGFSQLKGVVKATSGYSGGQTENPTYEEVGSEQTGHAEAVQVIYNPNEISFANLLKAFFYMHDPTQLNRQGPDIGSSYRSIAFYNSDEEKKEIETAINQFNATKFTGAKIVTAVEKFEVFYPAENYHQNYLRTHPNDAYIVNVCGPKLLKLKAGVPELLKVEYR